MFPEIPTVHFCFCFQCFWGQFSKLSPFQCPEVSSLSSFDSFSVSGLTFSSVTHFEFCFFLEWKVRVWFYSPCGHSFPRAIDGKGCPFFSAYSSRLCRCVDSRVYNSVPLVCGSVFVPVLCCFNWWSFVICFSRAVKQLLRWSRRSSEAQAFWRRDTQPMSLWQMFYWNCWWECVSSLFPCCLHTLGFSLSHSEPVLSFPFACF